MSYCSDVRIEIKTEDKETFEKAIEHIGAPEAVRDYKDGRTVYVWNYYNHWELDAKVFGSLRVWMRKHEYNYIRAGEETDDIDDVFNLGGDVHVGLTVNVYTMDEDGEIE